MSLSDVEFMVRERLGLDPEALGATALPRAVERRIVTRGVTADNYPALVSADPTEQQALADELVVPETWFFRGGRRLFDALAKFVSARAANLPPCTPVRVLSVPCSTGEEPYSLVIALHEQQVAPDVHRIEGVDLSAAHLTRATAGQFTNFAFRDTGADVRATHFQQAGDRWELHHAIREGVRFRVGNVADTGFLVGEAPFDLILCRNLFIYLTSDTRRRALANLERLLAPDGWLVLSPAEADRLPPDRFISTGPAEFGIYCRTGALRPVADSPRTPTRKLAPKPQPAHTHGGSRTATAKRASLPEPIAPVATLEAARKLADAGRLVEARAACERLLVGSAYDPNVYSLLGIVRLAQGAPADAAEAFRKALYLDPNHTEAIGHMIVICDMRRDPAQAAALRKRLARLTAEESS
jgi:chemotaxis protein methyltransferase WspC